MAERGTERERRLAEWWRVKAMLRCKLKPGALAGAERGGAFYLVLYVGTFDICISNGFGIFFFLYLDFFLVLSFCIILLGQRTYGRDGLRTFR